MNIRYTMGVLREAWRRFVDDDHMVYAGHMAFTLILSFGPFVVCAILLAKTVDPLADEHLIEMLRQLEQSAILPSAMAELFIGVIRQVAPEGSTFDLADGDWLVLIPALIGLYAGSSAFEAARHGFNEAYDVRDRRNVLFRRFQSHLLALCIASLFILASLAFVSITVSFNILEQIQAELGLEGAAEQFWSVVLLLLVGGLVFLVFWGLLLGIHVTLPRGYVKRWHLYVWAQDEIDDIRAVRVPLRPGVRVSALLWIAFAVGYSLVLGNVVSFDNNHGPLAAVIGTLLFFYISAAAIFFGAQINIAIATIGKDGKPKWPHPSLKRPADFDEAKLEAFQVLTRSKPDRRFQRLWFYICGGTATWDNAPKPSDDATRSAETP